jgi:hypothetical protein
MFAYGVVIVFLCLSLAILDRGSIFFDLAIGGAVGLLVPLVDAAVQNRRLLRIGYYSLRYPRRRIRVSVSYLIRITVDGEYLLVKGRRFPQFQPVGGVYKILPEARLVASRFKALSDNLVPVDPVSQHDLRLRIPSTKLVSFVQWFESGLDREQGPSREFFEELVIEGILPCNAFASTRFRFIDRVIQPLRYSPYANSQELLIADIFEADLSPEQEEKLRQLKRLSSPDVQWVNEDQIRRLGAVPGTNQQLRIAETAIWVLDA